MGKVELIEIPKQFVRFAVVGLVSNFTLYCLYLSLTYLGITPKYAMTSLYVIGVSQTFFFNKRWTFNHTKTGKSILFRYLASYLIGYLINLLILYVLVDRLNYSHQLVQGGAIAFLACILFLLQKKWVFR